MPKLRPIDVVNSFLTGEAIEVIDAKLLVLAKESPKNILDVFADIKEYSDLHYSHNDSALRQKSYLEWLKKPAITDDNLLHFLEFLSQDHPRITCLLERIHQTKNPVSYASYIFGGALFSCIGASLYFYMTDSWYNFLDFIHVTTPQIATWLLQYILLPQNLSAIIFASQLFNTFSTLHKASADRTTPNSSKLIKIAIVALLTLTAQAISFLYVDILKIIPGFLLIIASLIESIWLYTLSMKKSSNEIESQAFQEKNTKQFHYELASWALITIASIISFMFSPYLPFISTMIVVFQFLVSTAKDYYLNKSNQNYISELQSKIRNSAPEDPVNTASPRPLTSLFHPPHPPCSDIPSNLLTK
ncbi:MAG: hypothetical protein WCJ72_18710 [Chryseobacterium sp.]